MIGIVRRLFGDRGFVVLLILGIVGAWLYVRGAEAARDRDRYAAWADAACAAAGAPYAASTARIDGGTVTYPAGQRCRSAIATAVAFRADTHRATAAALAQAMRDHDARQTADAALARTAAEAARDATARMEKADAQAAPTNRVDRDWFAALNDVAGLHPPGDRGAGR